DKAGIHFGCTKDEYSISRNPDSDNILIQFTLSAVGTHFFSFCSPSRGPTSLICTCFGQRFIDHPSYYFSFSSWKLCCGFSVPCIDPHCFDCAFILFLN